MHLGLFFSYKTSLNDWLNSGILNRELEIFDYLNEKHSLQVTLFTYGGSEDMEIDLERDYVNIVPMETYFKNDINILKSIFLPFLISKDIQKLDLIQQNQLNGNWVSIISKFLYKKPLVTRTGYDMYRFAINNNKTRTKIFLYYLLTKFSLILTDIYTVTSNADFDFLKNKFSVNSYKIKVRKNWVSNISKEYRKDLKLNKILCVGRLVNQKYFQKILKDFKNTKGEIEIDIVGLGPLKKELEDYGNSNFVKINFLGQLENSKLKQLYKNYTFFITSSKFEGNPKSLLEAMASGCFVIASKIESHQEIIKSGYNGILFDLEKENTYEIYKSTLNNPILLSENRKNAIDSIKENNNLSTIANLFYKDYKEILNFN